MAVGADRLYPCRFRDFGDRGSNRLGEGKSDREVDPGLAQVLKHLVTGPSAIDADQDLAVKRFWVELLQRLVEDGDVNGHGV